ncbi:MAG: AAA family ATPase [Candidatus Methylacidiphilaceae bacterium]
MIFHPLKPNSKIPVTSEWPKLTANVPIPPGHNTGGVLQLGEAVIDLDLGHFPVNLDPSQREVWVEAAKGAVRAGLGKLLKGARVVETPSGGLHLFIRSDATESMEPLKVPVPDFPDCPLGVDLLGPGRNVALPPSTIDGKAYRVLKAGADPLPLVSMALIRAALGIQKALPAKTLIQGETAPGPFGVVNLSPEEAVSFGTHAEKILAEIASAGIEILDKRPGSRELLVDVRCPNEAQHTEKEPGTASSFLLGISDKGSTYRSFRCLHAHCQSIRYQDALDLARKKSGALVLREPNRLAPTGGRIRLTPVSEYPSRTAEWLIPNLLVKGTPNLLDGVEGVGKTFLCIYLAKLILDGGGSVVFICEHPDSLRARFEAAGVDVNACGERLAVLNRAVPVPNGSDELRDPLLSDPEVAQTIRDKKPDLAIIDPIWRFYGEEKVTYAEQFVAITEAFSAACRSVGATSLFTNHLGKTPKPHAIHDSYGTGGLTRDVRFALRIGEVEKDSGKLALVCVKSSDFAKPPAREVVIKSNGKAAFLEIVGERPEWSAADIAGSGRGEKNRVAQIEEKILELLEEYNHPLDRAWLATEGLRVDRDSATFRRAISALKNRGDITTMRYSTPPGATYERRDFIAMPAYKWPDNIAEAQKLSWWSKNAGEDHSPYLIRTVDSGDLLPEENAVRISAVRINPEEQTDPHRSAPPETKPENPQNSAYTKNDETPEDEFGGMFANG